MVYPDDIYMSPRNAVARFNALIKKHGLSKIEKSGTFKEEKELLAAGTFLLGYQKLVGYKYYLRPGEDITADIDIRAIAWGIDGDHFEHLDIQVTEFEGHSKELIDVITKKIAKQAKSGVENRLLLVNIRDHGGHKFYTTKIAKAVEALKPSFKSIWLLMDDYEEKWIYHAIRIAPTPQIIEINYNLQDEFNAQEPPDYIRISRGARNESLSSLYEYELPLP